MIGNGNYRNASPLSNPANDARDMATTLRSLGFEVLEGEDQTAEQMVQLIYQFGERLKQKGGVGLFYYAGHGVQVGGRNYLIPVEASALREQTIEFDAVDVGRVLAEMKAAGNGSNIIVLDACRSNPFLRGRRSVENGLAEIRASGGTLIAYATSPGEVADDGTGRNGVYTSELLKQIKVPGLSVEAMFKKVRERIAELTEGRQVPWVATSWLGDFYFTGIAEKNSGLTRSDVPSPVDVSKGSKDDPLRGERAAKPLDYLAPRPDAKPVSVGRINPVPHVFDTPGALISAMGIPEGLSQILKDTQGVSHIALGLQDTWLVVEDDKVVSSGGSAEFQTNIAALRAPLNLVAFAPNGGWVIVEGPNGFMTNNVPQELVDVLKAVNKRGKAIYDIDFHPAGGWVVIAEDMTTTRGIPADVNRVLMEITKNRGVSQVAFGSKGWVIIPKTGGYHASGIPAKLLSELLEASRAERTVYDIQLMSDEGWVLITAGINR